MNKKRRKALREALQLLTKLKDNDMSVSAAIEIIEKAHHIVDLEMDNEQECVDNFPDNLYWSAQSESFRDNVDDLESAVDILSDVLDDLSQDTDYDYEEIHIEITEIVHKIEDAIYR